MKKITSIVTAMLGLAIALAFVVQAQTADATTFISSYMGVGSRGSDVTTLQSFLASQPSIYPEGLVTGYFGSLTRAAVVRFQIANGIQAVGRVGPITLARINALIGAGSGLDTAAPMNSNISVQVSSTSATVNWTTNESSRAKVFYNTSPIVAMETDRDFVEPSVVGGFVTADATFKTNQSITLQNLSSNTTYYFMTESIDAQGNVTVYRGSFKTQ